MLLLVQSQFQFVELKGTVVSDNLVETPFSNIDRYKIRNNKIKDIEKNV